MEDTGSADTGYTDNTVEKGVEYQYRVSARNEAGPGEASGWVRAGPEEEPVWGDGPPGAPGKLTVTAGDRELTLSWEPPDDNGNAPAERYRIDYRIDGKDYNKSHWGTSGKTTYTKTHLANGIKYIFWVKAENDNGHGPASEEVSGTPTSGSAVDLGTPVLSNTKTLHHGVVKLDWEDIEDAGWTWSSTTTSTGAMGSGWTLPAVGVDIAFHGSSAVVSNLDWGIKWVRVRAMSCAGELEWSQIEELYVNRASDWEGVPVPEVEAGDEIEPCPEDVDTPDNSPATGAPAITGTAQLGEMLTANTTGIADADGLADVSYTYQWLADDTAIQGAISSSYTLVEADEGKVIRVRVTFTDDAGNEATLTSAATDAVAAAPKPNNPATGAPTISGTAQVGETLTADTSGIADEDGLDDVSFTYQWTGDGEDIAGATGATYTLVEADKDKTVTVEVSFTDDAGNNEALTSAATAAVAAAPTPNSPATGAPTISGTAQVGETLTANTSGVTDADGLSNVQYEYQWFADNTAIQGATDATYTLAVADEGKAITVQVTFTDDAGNDETLTSAATDAVAAAEPSEPPAKPTGLSATASHDQVVLTWARLRTTPSPATSS